MSKNTRITLLLVALAVIIAAFPLYFNLGDPDAEEPFAGADATAEVIVEENNPDYEPWASPVIEDLPGEVESGLFALQAALGAGVVGYVLGVYRGRARERAAATAESGVEKQVVHD